MQKVEYEYIPRIVGTTYALVINQRNELSLLRENGFQRTQKRRKKRIQISMKK